MVSSAPCEQLSKSGTQRISDDEKRISIVEPQLHQGWFQKNIQNVILPKINCRAAIAPRLVPEDVQNGIISNMKLELKF